MRFSILISLLAISAVFQLVAGIGEPKTDNIAVEPMDPSCAGKMSGADGTGCKYANGWVMNNYPPNFPCPCQVGTPGGAFPGTGKKSEPSPYTGQFLEETVVATAAAENPPFNNLVGMAWTDNTKELFIITKAGQVYRVDLVTKVRTLWINLGDEANNAADKGLIGIEVNPNFAANPYVYLSITVDPIYGQPDEDMAMPTFHRIIRYKSAGATADAASRLVLIGNNAADGIISCSTSHIGGAIAFGHDGSLFITTGEGSHFDWNDGDYGQNLTDYDKTCANNHPNEHVGSMRAQMLDSMSGKVLRINPNTGDGICPGSGFQVSNPFCTGDAKQFRSKVWALGFRNPYSANVRPLKAGESPLEPGTLYVGDVGFGSFEEVNEVQAGDNFGWPCWEGPLPAPIHRDSPWDDIQKNPQIFRPVQNGTAINCNYIYKNIKTKHPWFYYSRYPKNAGLAGKDNEYLGQGFLGNCIGGVSFYTGENYPTEMKDSVWILEFGQPWLRVAYRAADGSYSKIQDYNNYGTPTLDLEVDPQTKDICFLQQYKGVICVRYSAGNAAPAVTVGASPDSGAAPLSVQFNVDGTYDRENDNITIQWQFGDGQTSTLPNPTHVYTAPGTYTAIFTATDSKGAARIQQQVITVNGDAPPKIRITSPLSVGQGMVTPDNWFFYEKDQVLNFDCTVEDEDVNSLIYRWEVQMVHLNHLHPDTVVNNNKAFSANVNTLGAEGHGGERANFRVILTVTDASGNQAEAEFFMNPSDWETAWGNKVAVPVFNITAAQQAQHQPVQVTAFGTLDENLDYLWYEWNWGDGSTGSGMETSHLYNYGGTYTITLTVYDNWSGFATLSKEITLTGDAAPPSSTVDTNNSNTDTNNPSATQTNDTNNSNPATSDDQTESIPDETEQEGSATRGSVMIAGIIVLSSAVLLL